MARKAAKEKEGIGARVEALRNKKGWTQEELACRVSVFVGGEELGGVICNFQYDKAADRIRKHGF